MATIFPGSFQVRRKSAATWTSENYILLSGEMGLETDTLKFKFGDGSTGWRNLSYASSGGAGTGSDIDGGVSDSKYAGTIGIDGGNAFSVPSQGINGGTA